MIGAGDGPAWRASLSVRRAAIERGDKGDTGVAVGVFAGAGRRGDAGVVAGMAAGEAVGRGERRVNEGEVARTGGEKGGGVAEPAQHPDPSPGGRYGRLALQDMFCPLDVWRQSSISCFAMRGPLVVRLSSALCFLSDFSFRLSSSLPPFPAIPFPLQHNRRSSHVGSWRRTELEGWQERQ